ncbi:MAG: BatD family protein [Verrucomicrobiota bacterium]
MISPRSLLRPPVLALLLAAGSAAAQVIDTQPRVTPQLSARSIAVGDQSVLAYRITSGTGDGLEDYPREIVIPNLSVIFSGTGRRLVSVNGTAATVIEVRYMVQAEKPGTYTIPGQIFRVDGQDITADAVTVEVRDGPAVAEDMAPSAQLTIGKTEMWKGESVPVEVAVLVHPSVQPAGQFVAQLKSTGFSVHRFDRRASVNQRLINGEPWRTWQVESAMTPLQPGVQTFGPALVEMDVFMPFAGGAGIPRDPYGSMGSPATRKALKISSNSIEINVKELPAEGKPEGFSGAVGEFDIEIMATPTTLKIGEPIAVEIAIRGTGSFEAVGPPPMASKDGWRTYEARVAQENRGLNTEPGARSYTQIIIPEKNLTEIPSFVLNYFDPVKGIYVSKKSPPVALVVTGDIPAATAPSEMKDFNASSEAAVPGEELNDILSKPLTGGRWISTAAVPIPASPWLLHGVPAALLALVLGSGIARRLRAAAAARRPETDAPRAPVEILSDLRRTPVNRRPFYALVNEYLESFRFHSRRPLPGSPEFTALLADRDRWLYGPANPETEAPLPAGEQKSVLTLLPRIPHSL